MIIKVFILSTLLLLISFNISYTQNFIDSGGLLIPQQAGYDVKFYDLDLNIDTENRYISGSLLARCKILNEIDTLVLDLYDTYTIDSILFKKETEAFTNVSFRHSEGRIYIPIPTIISINDQISVKIYYQGYPKLHHIWWTVGFDWSQTPSGKPWIGVHSEQIGADIWWPCKDHPSDEPDSMALHFTVPQPLTCVSNGRFMGSDFNIDGTTTFNWFVSTPINNYSVSLNIAEYSLIEDKYYSTSGDSIPFFFWVIPEDYEKAVNHLPKFLKEFQFLESICGPFPFGMDKHGLAQSFYFSGAMEHQTIIDYKGDFQVQSEWGYDYIHLHELAHEWWGNFVTAKDWSDLWIHEGLATYMQSLYVERLLGNAAYHSHIRKRFRDDYDHPLAPRSSLTALDAFSQVSAYGRGATVLHTLRFHLGDENFFSVLKHWAYIDTSDIDNTKGRLCRLSTTDDMKEIAEMVTGIELDPFFEVFFREGSVPYLQVRRLDNEAEFTWITETNVALDLDVQLSVNGSEQYVEMTVGKGRINVLETDDLVIDPNQWILMAEPILTNIDVKLSENIQKKFHLSQNHPNPFNPLTKISYSIKELSKVSLKVFDISGSEISTLVNKEQPQGNYEIEFDGTNLASGIYFYRLQAADFVETKKMVLMK
jgi:aminopeptidase N